MESTIPPLSISCKSEHVGRIKTPDGAASQASLLVSKAGTMQSELALALGTEVCTCATVDKTVPTVRKTSVVFVTPKRFPAQLVETSWFGGWKSIFGGDFSQDRGESLAKFLFCRCNQSILVAGE